MSVAIAPSERGLQTTRTTVLVYMSTLFLSSFLMFLLEPMAAKMLLPLLGGAPAVWNTCVVFFQAMLLAGYAYAHAGPAWFGVRRHAAFHLLVVVMPLFALPFAIGSSGASPEGHPIAWLLMALLTSIGLPFFVLTTTAPLLQKWFSRTDHPAARDPYFLYAASNIGSLTGLVMYPGAMEPMLRLRHQAHAWGVGYGVFAAMVVGCAVLMWRRSTLSQTTATNGSSAFAQELDVPPGIVRRIRWVALAFAPSSLMLAVTTFVSTDVAAVPLLWIVPLGLYLLSFVMAFSSPPRYPRAVVDRGLPLLLIPLVFLIILRVTGPMSVVVPVHLAVFFLVALFCHRELADDRPPAVHLTEFYFWVALGGILGSLFNTLAAPVMFTGIVEYPLVLVLVCLLRRVPADETHASLGRVSNYALAVAAGGLTLLVMLNTSRLESTTLRFALLAVPGFLCLRLSRSRLSFALAISLMLAASIFQSDQHGTVRYAERTFFGTYRVRLDPTSQYRTLSHGTTLHGMQSVAPARRGEPLSYYHRAGPFGELFSRVPIAATHQEMAVVGLGVGSLAAYKHGEQRWTFYEIDPAVERIARNPEHFTFLTNCGEACEVVLGDARLSLKNAPDRKYGLIVLDAFSSDAIPIHLMTREALELYLARLAPGGVLAFHISNRHLALEPVLARLAGHLGLASVIRRDRVTADEVAAGKTSSDWLVMAHDKADMGSLTTDARWAPSVTSPRVPLWTDDFSNILGVLARR